MDDLLQSEQAARITVDYIPVKSVVYREQQAAK